MSTYTIIGGGLSGLLCAKSLLSQGRAVLGFEKKDRLASDLVPGGYRLYSSESVEFFKNTIGFEDWNYAESDAQERHKGGWRDPQGEFLDEERYFLRRGFFAPRTGYGTFVDDLVDKVGGNFKLRQSVLGVDSEAKRLRFQDGSETTYDVLIWCAPTESLIAGLGEAGLPLKRLLRRSDEEHGCLAVEFQLSEPLFPFSSTAVLPFRYKDFKLRALGISEPVPNSMEVRLHWMVYLDNEMADDREEVAKCVRALKRELLKEFPNLKDLSRGERISYLPSLSGKSPSPAKSLEIVRDIYYSGSKMALKNAPEGCVGLDCAVFNCISLKETLAEDSGEGGINN